MIKIFDKEIHWKDFDFINVCMQHNDDFASIPMRFNCMLDRGLDQYLHFWDTLTHDQFKSKLPIDNSKGHSSLTYHFTGDTLSAWHAINACTEVFNDRLDDLTINIGSKKAMHSVFEFMDELCLYASCLEPFALHIAFTGKLESIIEIYDMFPNQEDRLLEAVIKLVHHTKIKEFGFRFDHGFNSVHSSVATDIADICRLPLHQRKSLPIASNSKSASKRT